MKLKKIISSIATAVLCGAFAVAGVGCGSEDNWKMPENTEEYNIPQDYYRTYYEVFVRSFADGNGDGIGDLRGLINNLDYLNDGDDSTMDDLGINGIWMMPINSSPTYHKYDVTDYYNIDKEYGTLDDFDELVRECNKRDIWLQMDLVLNHTSSKHPWFTQALADARNGKNPDNSEAMQRYVFVREDERDSQGKYYKVSGSSFYYLGNFSQDMPDLNLMNDSVREEITKIVDFWLERGIRSFRLDAVPWGCANSVVYNEENAEFWSWFNDYCNEKGGEVYGTENDGINRYCYNVGEVWGDAGVVNDYFETGMSNFNYSYSGGAATGGFAQVANAQSSRAIAANLVNNMANTQAEVLKRDENAILSNFLTNHDNDRLAAMYGSVAKLKSAASLYMLMPGNCYIYYGEEIGAKGTSNDPNRRMPFNWGDGARGLTSNPPGVNYDGEQDYGTQSAQNVESDSVLTYYRYTIQLRNRFPEIARGAMTAYAVDASGALALSATVRENLGTSSVTTVNTLNKTVAAYTLTWNGKTVLIVHNFGEEASVGMSAFDNYGIVGTLYANGGSITLDGGKLTMPSNSVTVLKAA